MTDDRFRYAMRYFRYGGQYVDYGDDLRELVRQAESSEDYGEQSTAGFYEMVDNRWVELDASEIVEEVRRARDAKCDQLARLAGEKPYRIYVFGPNNIDDWWSSHATEAEAHAAAAQLPKALRALVTTDKTRPWRHAAELDDITVPLPKVASRSGE